MKTKRILALILAMIFCALAFVGCSKDKNNGEETTPTVEPLKDELKNYTIIRSEAQSDIATRCMKLSSAIGTLTGGSVSVRNDEGVVADDNTFEILVGDTNRAQSSEAKAKLNGLSFSITKNGNKIVIVAANILILEDAIDYFIANLKKLDDGTVEYPTNYTETGYQALDLVTNGKANYDIVFTDFYNNLNYHSGNIVNGKGENDYKTGFTQTKAKDFVASLKTLTGASFSYFSESNKSASKKEIIIGKPNGDTNDYFEYHESGVYLKDGDIYLYGHNHEGIEYAISSFLDRVTRYNKLEKGKYSILCNTQGFKFSNSNIKYNIPLPNGLQYEGAYTAANNGIYFVYENCTQANFDAYCNELKAAGCTQYFARKASTNAFAGFYNGDDAAWVYYIADRKELRVVFEGYQALPDFTKSSGAKVQDAYVTQMGISYDTSNKHYGAGMGYIIGLEDGRYVVVDGNISYVKDKTLLATRYYDYMKANNKHASGKIVIAAWIVTHSHSDHYSNFEQFGKKYGSQVECQYIIHNLPTELTLWGGANMDNKYLDHNYKQKDVNFKGAVSFTVHTGYAATIGGVDLEFMSTYEDLYNNNALVKYSIDSTNSPNCVDELNDTCLTFRFSFNNGSGSSTVIFLGDNYFAHGERLASMWDAAYLKSDVVQMAHHGYANGTGNAHEKQLGETTTYINNTYKEIAAEYGFCSGPSGRLTDAQGHVKIMKEANSKFSTYNIYYNDYAGVAKNAKMTFNGGINVKLSTVV